MKKINNILLPTDFSSCSKRAAAEAFALASRCSATSHLLYASTTRAQSDFWPGLMPNEHEILMEPETTVARDMSALLQGREIDESRLFKIQVRGSDETSSIVSYARENPIDLIIIGAHGEQSGVTHEDAMGSVARDIVRSAPCPVITLKEDRAEQHLARLNTILAPLDFSEITEATLTQAADLAVAFGSTLQLLHVVQGEQAMSHALGTMAQIRDRVRAKLNGAARVEIDMVIGDPAREITRFAEENACDLIYLTRKDEVNGPMMGRITEYVFHEAGCPVYIAPISA